MVGGDAGCVVEDAVERALQMIISTSLVRVNK